MFDLLSRRKRLSSVSDGFFVVIPQLNVTGRPGNQFNSLERVPRLLYVSLS